MLKDKVMELLQTGAEQELAELVVQDRRAIRPLLGRLWDPDASIRQRAARAVGAAAVAHPDLGVELIRRLLWALNDESGTNGVYGLAALGEIGRQRPSLLAPYLSALASMAWDEGLRLQLLRAFEAVATSAPELVAPHLDSMRPYIAWESRDEWESYQRLVKLTGGLSHGD
jgi:hypothetical protein